MSITMSRNTNEYTSMITNNNNSNHSNTTTNNDNNSNSDSNDRDKALAASRTYYAIRYYNNIYIYI